MFSIVAKMSVKSVWLCFWLLPSCPRSQCCGFNCCQAVHESMLLFQLLPSCPWINVVVVPIVAKLSTYSMLLCFRLLPSYLYNQYQCGCVFYCSKIFSVINVIVFDCFKDVQVVNGVVFSIINVVVFLIVLLFSA